VNYYDKAFDRVTVKTETSLPSSIPPEKGTFHPAPNPGSDHLLKRFGQQVAKEAKEAAKNAQDDEVYPTKTVISSDVIIAALMSCTKSVYSWDLIVDKRGDLLTLDKRDGGALGTVFSHPSRNLRANSVFASLYFYRFQLCE
jgi:translation initiation factor 3 subunit D